MATMAEANPTSHDPEGGVPGWPDRVSHTRTRVPAGAPQMPGAVVVVKNPDRRCPSGARQRAAYRPDRIVHDHHLRPVSAHHVPARDVLDLTLAIREAQP